MTNWNRADYTPSGGCAAYVQMEKGSVYIIPDSRILVTPVEVCQLGRVG